jgi:hypothetical protein
MTAAKRTRHRMELMETNGEGGLVISHVPGPEAPISRNARTFRMQNTDGRGKVVVR